MRRRLYFMVPDTASAEQIEDELLLARIEASHIHFLARRNMGLGQLHEANMLQKSDLLHSMGTGLIAGGLTGLVGGVLSYLYTDLGSQLGLSTVPMLALAGALFGTWAAGLVGISIPNSRLKSFEEKINQGQILLMVDAPRGRVHEITEMLHKHHPEAADKGVEPTIPAFP